MDIIVPADGTEFKLTMSEIINPLAMIYAAGHNPELLKFKGVLDMIPRTVKFKLVRIGCRTDFFHVPRALKRHGFIPEGQWREVLRKTYPLNDGRGPIGIPNASWVHLYDGACFPVLDGLCGKIWHPGFSRVKNDYDASWRWLVQVSN